MINRPFAHIAGVGGSAPSRVITNTDLEKTLDTSNEWIVERTGIRERRYAEPGETLISYTVSAVTKALTAANITPAELDGIIFGTVSPDRRLPSAACDLQAAIGAENAWAFDVAAACPGWIYAASIAESMIATGLGDNILVVGAEKLTSILDHGDRSTAILFGDGAGVAILRRNQPGDSRGILSSHLGSDGRLAHLLYMPAESELDRATLPDGSRPHCYIQMAGRLIYKAAVHAMSQASDAAMAQAGVTGDQIDLMIPHQANLRIIESTAKHVGMSMDKVFVNLDKFGNTSAGSIPLALAEAAESGRLQPGMLVLLVSFGAGLTWGSMVVRW